MARVELVDLLRGIPREAPTAPPVPKYAQCDRKDARLRVDQTPALTELADTLMGRRTVKTERITENTLIRVAIDLLLANTDALTGSTEDELRSSALAARASDGVSAPKRGKN